MSICQIQEGQKWLFCRMTMTLCWFLWFLPNLYIFSQAKLKNELKLERKPIQSYLCDCSMEIRKQRLNSNETIQVNSFSKALRIMDQALIESDMHMASEIFCPWSSWQWEESCKKTTAGHSVVDTDNKLLLANYRAAEAETSRAGNCADNLNPECFTVIEDHDHINMPFFYSI